MPGRQNLEFFRLITQKMKDSNSFERHLQKVKIISAENGKCQAEFKVEPEHQNLGGTLHGGFSATLVDCISTYALMTYGRQIPGVSVDMHVKYLKAAFEGDDIIIDAQTIKAGKNLEFLEVTLKDKENGDIVVMGSHTKFIG